MFTGVDKDNPKDWLERFEIAARPNNTKKDFLKNAKLLMEVVEAGMEQERTAPRTRKG